MKISHEQIVPAYLVRGTGQIAYWCHYCRCVHRHGDCGKGMAGGGGRDSHCSNEDSPLRGRGIFLDVLGEVSSEDDLRPKRQPRRHQHQRGCGEMNKSSEPQSDACQRISALLSLGDCIRKFDRGLSSLILRGNRGDVLDRKISRRALRARRFCNKLRSEVDEMACAIFPDEQSDPKRLALRVAYRDALSPSERKEIVRNAESRALGNCKQAHAALPADAKDVPAI